MKRNYSQAEIDSRNAIMNVLVDAEIMLGYALSDDFNDNADFISRVNARGIGCKEYETFLNSAFLKSERKKLIKLRGKIMTLRSELVEKTTYIDNNLNESKKQQNKEREEKIKNLTKDISIEDLEKLLKKR